MRSLADRVRLERALRLAAFALLAFCAWALTGGRGDGGIGGQEHLTSAGLVEWTRRSPGDSLAVSLKSAPSAVQRDWLRALGAAGTQIAWSGTVSATAIEVLPVPDPAGGFVVLGAAPAGAWVALADSLGAIDSVRVGRSGVVFRAAAHTGTLRTMGAGQETRAAAPDSLAARRAVVIGRAGWETRFVITALEERGWIVDARVAVGPGVAVTQGRPLPLDTARQSVVIAIDSLAEPDVGAIARFVAAGGGAVLAPPAAATMPSLAAGRVAAHVRPPTVAFSAASPRGGLALDPVLPRADAIVLERQRGHVVLAARRAGAGRVVQSGYDETWRWRMGGGDDAVEAHREWWTQTVAAAAYRPDRGPGTGDRGPGNDGSPLASLVAALGPASQAAAASAALPDPRRFLLPAALLLFAALLGEWTSRRLRGAA